MVPYQPQKMAAGALVSYVASSTDWSQVIAWVYNNQSYLKSMGYSTQQAISYLRSWWNGSHPSPSTGAITNAPVARSQRVRVFKPRVTGIKGGVTIRHREYVADVAGNTTFGVTSFTVQPGLAASFPWLSGIANNFEKYRVKSMSMQYINVAATDERGRITIAFDRDPLDADPETKADLFSYKGATEGSVWTGTTLSVPGGPDLFTRNGTVTGTDLKTYDYGKFLVGVSNTADTAVVGELFINYEIELTIPQPATCPAVTITSGGTVSKTAIFGDAPTTVGNGPLTVTGSTITFTSPGDYLISLVATGTSPGSPTVNTGTASNSSSPSLTVTDGGSSTASAFVRAVRATAPGQTFIITYGGTAVTSSSTVVTMMSSATF